MRLRRLFVAISMISAGSLVHAGQATSLESITVSTASKREQALEQSTVSVQVITEEDIQDMGAVTLRDVFLNTSGIHLPLLGGGRKNPNVPPVLIRGVGGMDTLWLIDGRRFAGERVQHYELDRIPASSIERIEIVKGPMGVLYGSNAIGGVINIITKRPREGMEGLLDISAGANTEGDGGRYALSGDLRGGNKNTQFSLRVSALKGTSYTEREIAEVRVPGGNGNRVPPSTSGNQYIKNNLHDSYPVDFSYRDEAEVYSLGASLLHHLSSALRLTLDANVLDEDREGYYISPKYPTNINNNNNNEKIPAFNIPVRKTDDNRRQDLVATLDWKAFDGLELSLRSYRSHYDKNNITHAVPWKDMGYPSEAASKNAVLADITIIGHELTTIWKPAANHTVLIGGEYRDEDLEANVFNRKRTMETRSVTYNSFYFQHEWLPTPALTLAYGARYDDASNVKDHTSLNLSGLYTLSSAARLRASYAQGFRIASINERFVDRITPAGHLLGSEVVDPSVGKTAIRLKPETSDNYEIGLGGNSRTWRYDLAVFHNTIKNRIQQVAEGSYLTYRNISSARIRGMEAGGGFRILPKLWLNAALTLLDAENRETGRRLEFTPERTFTVSADWQAASRIKLNFAVQHIGDQVYTDTRDGKQQQASTDAYTLVNLRANYVPSGLRDVEFYAGVDNLFDAKVDKVLSSSVGPYLYLGARWFF